MTKNTKIAQLLNDQSDSMIVGEFVETHDWSEDASRVQRLFSDCLNDEDSDYLEMKLQKLQHKRDRRTAIEYGAELFRGWIVEDILVDIINTNSSCVTATVNGEDSNRKLLDTTTSDPDLSIDYNGDSRPVEVVTDYTEYWNRTGEMDFRGRKIQSIQDKNGIILAVDVTNQEVFIIDPQQTKTTYIDSHTPYGGKSAYKIQIEDVTRTNMSEVASVIEQEV